MEAAAMQSSQPLRKEWRVVSEQSLRSTEKGREPADVDFCSITIDGSLDNDILQQRLHSVVKRREEMQHMEVELRAQLIARSELMEMQSTYDSQTKEHLNANVKLQELLHEREQTIKELERRMEEKEREIHAIRLDNQAAWAKEDLLREQNNKLATFQRERDSSEAERSQHLKQIHECQEHIQEKERQYMELQEQHRVAQEAVIYKDEQIREAQNWITRAQEMDALQTSTNHTLQAELRERTEQYNQLWLGCQRQFAELERLHVHTIQQLQIELVDARERSGNNSDEVRISQANSKDVTHFGQSSESQHEGSGSGTPNGNPANFLSGNPESASTQTEHVPGVQIPPQSLLSMPTFLPPSQVTALHPFVMHQQGVPQSHAGHFHTVAAISPLQHWQSQQAVPEGSQVQNHNQYPSSQNEQNLLRSDTSYDYDVSANGQALCQDYLDSHISQGMEPQSVVPSSNGEGQGQVLESNDQGYLTVPQPQQGLQQISSQFHDALRLEPLEQNNETEKNTTTLANHAVQTQGFMTEQPISVPRTVETPIHPVNFGGNNHPAGGIQPEAFVSAGQKSAPVAGKTAEISLLDEKSLLACIVRTIPPGPASKIRISSTLPNRLGKMLAPLHWHDYKKKYGKLDDFVAAHSELFIIEGDYIQLREGAQNIIAATSALAKVTAAAAAAAATSTYPSLLPSVAVTPMAQPNRLKRAPSMDTKSGNSNSTIFNNQHVNGVSFNAVGGASTVKILSKPKDHMQLNGVVGNGSNLDRSDMGSSQMKGSTHGRPSANFTGKHPGRRS